MIFHWNICGIICVCFTYVFICYADYVVVFWLVIPTFSESLWGAIHLLAYNGLIVLAVFSHLRAMVTDPGIVPVTIEASACNKPKYKKETELAIDDDDEDYCTDSGDEALHRSHFVVCFCPWVNNCVGEFNQKYFLQFIFYVGLLSVYSVILIVGTWMIQDDYGLLEDKNHTGRSLYHLRVVHSICLGIESCLFGLFVLAVSCDQLQAIFNDETIVEAFQRRGGYRKRIARGKIALMQDVCGKGHWCFWLLPFSNSLPNNRDLVRFAKTRMEKI
ncbi:DHHC palmitoyltransferase domain-containing protein [Ditylenchus destructor]|uniref:Palmitoyltransferase n=1 Tax=Ditylenchus destructor TaxID=166010 RepID=A0AAD4NHA4_9BILA|nr:DHHC palmitoyltransferase domain-containing protein [Ditylenchus destructor]